MSVRRSSRIKALEIDDSTRQKILFQSGQPDPLTRSIHSGKIRDLPYSRTNGVNRLLRDSHYQCQQTNRSEDGGSPLRSAIGKFTDKLQDAIKGIFPFRLFSRISPDVPTESIRPSEPSSPAEERGHADNMRPSEPITSNEQIASSGSGQMKPSHQLSHSPTLEAAPQALEDEKEARRQAFSDLSAFFSAKKGQLVGPSDLTKIAHLFPTGSSPKPSMSHRASGVLMTPLPRRMASENSHRQQQSSISRMSSVQRIAPPPTTALKFRTRVPAPSFPPVVERSIVDEDVQAELAKSSQEVSSRTSPVKQSPMKIDFETKMSQEPSPKKEKRDQSTPNRFVGLFYLDPDEEEEELLEQDRAAQEQQKRIGTLAAKKEQRERKIAFRVTSEEKEEAKPAASAPPPAPLFDFGPSMTSTPRKEEERPLINLATPSKTATFELPSSTTRIGSADDDRESKRKRPAEQTESLFASKPAFNFGPLKIKPAEQERAADPHPFESRPTESSQVEPPKFSFAKPDEAQKAPLAFTFTPSAPSQEHPATPSLTVPAKPVESAPTEIKPAFTFGAPTDSKPAFTFPHVSTETSKPTFSFLPSEAEQEAQSETKPAFAFPGPAPSDKPAPLSSDKPLFSFGTMDKPAESMDKPAPSFTFGSAAPEKSAAPVFSFGAPGVTPATTSTPFTFGQQPKETERAKAPAFNFAPPAVSSESKPFTFGASAESKPFGESKPSFGGSAFGASAAPTSTFGSSSAPSPFSFLPQQQQQHSGMDMQIEGDGMAQPAPISAFGSASSSAFGFGGPASTKTSGAAKPFSFATGPSPAPSSATTPTFYFTSPSPTNQSTFAQQPSAAPVPATSPFTFGQPAQAQQTPTFVFGAQPSEGGGSGMDALASAAASGGGFNVGAGGSVTGARKTAPMTRARRR